MAPIVIGTLMTMQIYILSDVQLKSISDWQRAIEREGFSLSLADDTDFWRGSGFWPARLEQQSTGFERYNINPKELFDTYREIQFGRQWKYVLELVWGGDLRQMQAATMAATAYARATDGVVFDPQAGQFLTASEAFEAVQESKQFLSQLQGEA
jgi:hypothetical protein